MNMDVLLRAFFDLEEAHRHPILIDADGKRLHDSALVETGLYRHAPLAAMQGFVERASGVAIEGALLATATGPANPDWGARWDEPAVPCFNNADGSRTYLFANILASRADVQVGAYRYQCYNGSADIIRVPSDTAEWIVFPKHNLRPFPLPIAKAIEEASAA